MKPIIKLLTLTSAFSMALISLGITDVNAEGYLADKTETNYTQDQGLLTGKANAITSLENGFIYIGQYAGLTKYDSKTFIGPETGEEFGFDFSSTQKLCSVSNELYFATYKSAYCYIDGEYSEIILDESTDLKINDITNTSKYIYFSTNLGLYSYARVDDEIQNKTKGSVTKIVDKPNIIDASFISDHSYYYITTETVDDVTSNVCYYSNGNYDYTDDTIYYSYSDDGINIKTIYNTASNLYLASNTGVVIRTTVSYNRASQVSEKKVYDLGYETAINDMEYYGTSLYVATGLGLFIIDSENNIEFVDDIIATSNLEDLTFDYMGNLWIASSTTGVSKITTDAFVNTLYDYDISVSNVNAMEYYNGYYYIASDTEGLTILNSNTKEVISNVLVNELANSRLRDVIAFKDKIYIAAYDNSIYSLIEYDPITDTYINIDSKTLSQTTVDNSYAMNVRCLTSYNDTLYIGTNYGITSLTIDSSNNYTYETLKTITDSDSKRRPLYLNVIDNRLYVCFDQSSIVSYSLDLEQEEILVSGISPLKIESINGMLLYNDSNKLYYIKDGETYLCNLSITGSISEILYLNGKYYIGSDSSIYLVDDITKEDANVITLDKTFGFRASLIANSSGYYDSENEIYYFVTTKGIYQLDLTKEIISHTLKVNLNSITADGILMEGNSFKIKSDTKELVIDFSVLSYGNDDKYTVYYKLTGFDDDYQTLISVDKFQITYQNLKGGDYSFELYVVMSDNRISTNQINVSFTKSKQVYETVWFWVIIVLLVLAFFGIINFLLIKERTRKLLKRQNEYRKITIESIEAIARTIDAKDSYTNGHSVRVGHYSRLIAKELGLSKEEVDNIYYTALLHDIGKIAIPLSVLNKPGRLTDEEFEIMKSHTTEGAKILDGITTIPNIADGAKYHHERYDGKGYPNGLKGEEIPYVARIICCADCFDAMATKRVYKEPYPLDKIIGEYERCAGTQFDPKIAKVVIKLISEGKLKSEERKTNVLEADVKEQLKDIDEVNKKAEEI